ncbi:hypothetical protein [Empedobacter tilapiae]|uniref:PEP-CTERM sorting domain-containing protein n=1 Tax=Empedobacter tilapiae TaxID=2491114 RepID=A0A4Z1BLE5_9FLAO|nr:hypothetical protein [Empedobacter tilapiae]TGN22945.1 hypothetical protein E4J94_15530 [Empedobacter tilapiae]
MKNIKQILLIAGALFCTATVSAQKDKTSFFNSKSSALPGHDGGGTNEPDPEPNAPIDDYLPLLVVGAGLVALRFRKQLLKK